MSLFFQSPLGDLLKRGQWIKGLALERLIARILSEQLLALEFGLLPESVVEFARIAWVDWLGAVFPEPP